MLVAFQRTGEVRRLPAAAEHLVGLLRSWGPGPDHLTGLALTGITVPSRFGPRFVDALVFTRSGIVVIAAHSPGVGVSPGERAGAGVAAAKGALAAHDGGRYVTGLVAVVPPVGEPGLREAVPELRDRVAEPGGPDSAEEPPEPAAVRVPEPREPVAETRLPEGARESDRREAGPGGQDPGRSGRAGGPDGAWSGVGPSATEPEWGRREPGPDHAWGGPSLGEPDAGQAWRAAGPGGREPDHAWGGPIPGDPAPSQAWPAADPGQAFRETDPGEPELNQAWYEPNPFWYEADSFPGVAVVLADPRGLRRIIGQHNRWRTVWSADDVLDACYALSLAHLAPARAALLADGFPARVPRLERVPVLPAVVSLPPEPAVAAAHDAPGPRIPAPRGHAVFPRPRPIRQVPWGLVFVLTLLVTVGVIAAVFVAQVFHGS
ncbi:hypothetical protein [Amycolatopsis sp. NPDC051371]|uniref:hypothetical protein n=1 Tax=Amycolatopsis sp. NPDC051371 TaxID=3155800 RepID=UPI00342C4B40